MKWLVVPLLVLALYLGFELGKSWQRYRYLRVVDGDTIVLRDLRTREEVRMRLSGIDAPEIGECYFEEAKTLLALSLARRGVDFKILGRDGFGRLLGIVYANHVDVSQVLVGYGAAQVYQYEDIHDDIKPDRGYFSYLQKIQEETETKKIGIWSKVCEK